MFVHMVAFQASSPIDDEAVIASVVSATAELEFCRQVTVDLPVESEMYDRLGRRPNVFPGWNALVQVRADDPSREQREALAHGLSDVVDVVASWSVRRDVAWSRPPEGAGGVAVKQVSFVAKPDDLPLHEFEDRYRNHQGVAIEHHEGAFRYVQNIVLGHTPDAVRAAAISEMWFASEFELIHRYYTTPDSRAVTQADSQTFLDPRRTTWLLVRPQSRE